MHAETVCEQCGETIIIEFGPLLRTEANAYVQLSEDHHCGDARA